MSTVSWLDRSISTTVEFKKGTCKQPIRNFAWQKFWPQPTACCGASSRTSVYRGFRDHVCVPDLRMFFHWISSVTVCTSSLLSCSACQFFQWPIFWKSFSPVSGGVLQPNRRWFFWGFWTQIVWTLCSERQSFSCWAKSVAIDATCVEIVHVIRAPYLWVFHFYALNVMPSKFMQGEDAPGLRTSTQHQNSMELGTFRALRTVVHTTIACDSDRAAQALVLRDQIHGQLMLANKERKSKHMHALGSFCDHRFRFRVPCPIARQTVKICGNIWPPVIGPK